MRKVGKIEYKKIARISPSQFYSMTNCAYKSLLAEAFDKKPLLPISPNAYLGTVLHKMLELISKKEIKTDIEFNERFEAEILLIEKELKQTGYDIFVPLYMNVRDFGIKKIQLKKHLKGAAVQSNQSGNIKFIPEQWFESKDKTIGGKIDLIIESENEIEIIDFKTGAITEDIFDDNGESYQDIKREYQRQLKLYAYLFYDCTGKYPTKLSLVDLSKQKFNVEFSKQECDMIFQEAKALLIKTNNSIDNAIFHANPSESNCKYCLYRPACSFYFQHFKGNNSLNDVCGFIIGVIKYQNGNVSIFIRNENNKITITGFSADKYEYFNSNLNKQISLFNLRKEATEFIYSVIKTTAVYEC